MLEKSPSDGKPMRILFVSRAFGTQAGGMERLSWELHRELSSRAPVDRVTFSGARALTPLFILWCLPRALWQARRADIVYLGDPLLSFVGRVIQWSVRRPVVVTVHGLDILWPHPLYQAYLKLFFHRFNGYVAISEHVQRLLADRGLASRTVVITPGITDRFYNPRITRSDLRTLLGRPVDRAVVLATVGRLIARKGHAWFITTVLPLLPPQVLYVIAGEGPTVKSIAKAVREAQMSDRVIQLGRTSARDTQVLLNTVDAFVQPNILVTGDTEGFGIVLLEAAVCQRPVFASRLEGIPAALHHEINGYLLPAAEPQAWVQQLSDFIARPESYRRAGIRARAYTLATYRWQTIGQRYLAYFTEVINRESRGVF